jgi:thiol-disulfide isomerase/thioredoxin
MRTHKIINAAFLLAACFAAPQALPQTPEAQRLQVVDEDALTLPAGWIWALPPEDINAAWPDVLLSVHFTDRNCLMLYLSKDGQLKSSHTYMTDERGVFTAEAPKFQIYAFDAEGNAYTTGGHMAMDNDVGTIVSFQQTISTGVNPDGSKDYSAKLNPAELARVGIAVLDIEGQRKASELALREAKENGAHVLPLPVIGERYTFADMPLIDGGTISSADLKGKVVLIDCWSTYCGPCMKKMPRMQAMLEKHGRDKFAIIGVNSDFKPQEALAAIENKGLDWAHIHSPTAAGGDWSLWKRAFNLQGQPRIVIIDKKGVVRGDFLPPPENLEARIAELVAE